MQPSSGILRRPAFLAGLAAALVFIALALLITSHGGRPLELDRVLHGWFLDHRTKPLSTLAKLVTRSGTGIPVVILAALAGWYAGGRRGWPQGVLLAASAFGCVQLVRFGLSQWIARGRPPATDWVMSAGGFSFPSGHTSSAATVAALFVLAVRYRGGGNGYAIAAVFWAVAVGLTRVYLGVHWPTDVLGAWLLVLTVALLVGSTVGSPPGIIGRWAGREGPDPGPTSIDTTGESPDS
jgi:membrane-associated phospholipid phosphatase